MGWWDFYVKYMVCRYSVGLQREGGINYKLPAGLNKITKVMVINVYTLNCKA